jgi:hypothetical protein
MSPRCCSNLSGSCSFLVYTLIFIAEVRIRIADDSALGCFVDLRCLQGAFWGHLGGYVPAVAGRHLLLA